MAVAFPDYVLRNVSDPEERQKAINALAAKFTEESKTLDQQTALLNRLISESKASNITDEKRKLQQAKAASVRRVKAELEWRVIGYQTQMAKLVMDASVPESAAPAAAEQQQDKEQDVAETKEDEPKGLEEDDDEEMELSLPAESTQLSQPETQALPDSPVPPTVPPMPDAEAVQKALAVAAQLNELVSE